MDVEYFCKILYKDDLYKNVIHEKFDLCYSSHNIEHTPCLITFLNNISDILNTNGVVFMGIPDCHFVFDRYKTHTTIFDILNNFYNKIKQPRPLNILESTYYNCENDPFNHWNYELQNNNNSFILVNQKKKFFKFKIINNN